MVSADIVAALGVDSRIIWGFQTACRRSRWRTADSSGKSVGLGYLRVWDIGF